MKKLVDGYCYYPYHTDWLGRERKEKRIAGYCNVPWDLSQDEFPAYKQDSPLARPVHDFGHPPGRPYCKEHGGPTAGVPGDWCLECEVMRIRAIEGVNVWRQKTFGIENHLERVRARLPYWESLAILSLFPDEATREIVWRELQAMTEEDMPTHWQVMVFYLPVVTTVLEGLRHYKPDRLEAFLEKALQDSQSLWHLWAVYDAFNSKPDAAFAFFSDKLFELQGIDEVWATVSRLLHPLILPFVQSDYRWAELFARLLVRPLGDWESDLLLGWDDVYHLIKFHFLEGQLEAPIPDASLGRTFCRIFLERVGKENLLQHESYAIKNLARLILRECGG